MIKRILTFTFKDITSAIRDKIPLFMLLMPIFIAVIMRLFIPALEGGLITFVIDENSVEKEIIDKIENYGEIELIKGKEKVEERINKFDDIIGVIKENGKYILMYEGNESGEARELSKIVMESVLTEQDIINVKRESLNIAKSYMVELFISILMLANIMMAGMVVGLRLVDEKEMKTINALSVSPLRISEYIISIGIFIFILSTVLSLISLIILSGFSVNLLEVVLGIVVSIPLGILISFIVGGFASTQMTAIAIIKVLSIVYNGIAIGSLFVPKSLQFLFYPFPNYWMLQIYRNIFGINSPNPITVGFWVSCLLTLGTSLLLIFILLPFLKKKLKLK